MHVAGRLRRIKAGDRVAHRDPLIQRRDVASVNAFFHPDGLVIDYGAAKAALLNLAKALSQELGLNASESTASPRGR